VFFVDIVLFAAFLAAAVVFYALSYWFSNNQLFALAGAVIFIILGFYAASNGVTYYQVANQTVDNSHYWQYGNDSVTCVPCLSITNASNETCGCCSHSINTTYGGNSTTSYGYTPVSLPTNMNQGIGFLLAGVGLYTILGIGISRTRWKNA